MLALLILVISVLFLSGVCSMVEAAILSLPLVRARILFEQKRKGSKTLLFIKENIHLAVATIVILNNTINIVGAIFVGQLVIHLFGNRWLGVASTIITFAIIVIAEIIPKTIGEYHKVAISLFSAKPLRWLTWLLKPFVGILMIAANPFQHKSRPFKVTEEEIKIMLKLGRTTGTIEIDEETLCNRVFKLNDLVASQMMESLENAYVLQYDISLQDARDAIINSPYSRIVVYDKDISKVVGVCSQRVLLREIAKDNRTSLVRDFMSRPIFVNGEEKADSLLEKFQAYHQHLFIVRDSKKQNIGILTMEDVLEELFGEIYDEKD